MFMRHMLRSVKMQGELCDGVVPGPGRVHTDPPPPGQADY